MAAEYGWGSPGDGLFQAAAGESLRKRREPLDGLGAEDKHDDSGVGRVGDDDSSPGFTVASSTSSRPSVPPQVMTASLSGS
jgi:hypothetical protein